MADELLTTDQVAAELGVTARTVRVYINAGKLPAIKLSGYYLRIRRSKLKQFLREQETANGTD